ncbi:cobalamin B12-binding domain-containing protein [Nocardioides sp. AN3]
MTKQPRVLLTKSFIDSHDRAIKTIATALRDDGMEVVLVDYETPEDIVAMAIDEDVDVIGISFMSGGQVETTTDVLRILADRGSSGVPVVVGGTIRPFDVPALSDAGVSAIFRGGEMLAKVSARFQQLAADRQRTHA